MTLFAIALMIVAALATWLFRSQRLTALLSTGSVGAPIWRAERAFFTRREAGGEHPVLLVREPDGTAGAGRTRPWPQPRPRVFQVAGARGPPMGTGRAPSGHPAQPERPC